MSQYLSDLKISSIGLEESGYSSNFAQGLGLLEYEPLEIADTDSDEFEAQLTELKREALNHDINPLIGAATFLFVRIFQLEQARYRVETSLLQKELVNKIKCFVHYAKEAGYHPNLVLASRYLLCAFLDEYLDNSPLGKEKSWIKDGLLKVFRFDTEGDRFFLILKYGLNHSESHIDLLELIYLCLSFGFKGPYRYHLEGQKDLAIIIDHLYHHIRSVRGEFSKSLSVGEMSSTCLMLRSSAPKFRVLLFPFLLSIVVAIAFVVMNLHLGEKLSPLFNKLSHYSYSQYSADVPRLDRGNHSSAYRDRDPLDPADKPRDVGIGVSSLRLPSMMSCQRKLASRKLFQSKSLDTSFRWHDMVDKLMPMRDLGA